RLHDLHPHSFFFKRPTPPGFHTLSLHDALPISRRGAWSMRRLNWFGFWTLLGLVSGVQLFFADQRLALHPNAWWQALATTLPARSEEHTSELQSRGHLVFRLLLEQKKLRLTSNP